MRSCLKEFKKLAAELSVVIEREVPGNHVKLYVRNANGHRAMLVVSVTPKDPRTPLNEIGNLKRFARMEKTT